MILQNPAINRNLLQRSMVLCLSELPQRVTTFLNIFRLKLGKLKFYEYLARYVLFSLFRTKNIQKSSYSVATQYFERKYYENASMYLFEI